MSSSLAQPRRVLLIPLRPSPSRRRLARVAGLASSSLTGGRRVRHVVLRCWSRLHRLSGRVQDLRRVELILDWRGRIAGRRSPSTRLMFLLSLPCLRPSHRALRPHLLRPQDAGGPRRRLLRPALLYLRRAAHHLQATRHRSVTRVSWAISRATTREGPLLVGP